MAFKKKTGLDGVDGPKGVTFNDGKASRAPLSMTISLDEQLPEPKSAKAKKQVSAKRLGKSSKRGQ